MRDNRLDVGAVLMHVALVLTVVAGLALFARQLVVALTCVALSVGLFWLGRRMPASPAERMPTLTGPAEPRDEPRDEPPAPAPPRP